MNSFVCVWFVVGVRLLSHIDCNDNLINFWMHFRLTTDKTAGFLFPLIRQITSIGLPFLFSCSRRNFDCIFGPSRDHCQLHCENVIKNDQISSGWSKEETIDYNFARLFSARASVCCDLQHCCRDWFSWRQNAWNNFLFVLDKESVSAQSTIWSIFEWFSCIFELERIDADLKWETWAKQKSVRNPFTG